MSEGGTLTVYQRMNDPIDAVKMLGTAIAKSGMFGCGSIEQGQVFALECLTRGMPPLTLAERYHVVQGKLMMKYDAMLAEFHALGGKHVIVSRTEDKAEIELTIDGQTHRETLTWEEAQKEKWPYKSDGKSLKDNWATPRARRQMLWARVVSEGVRALCPGVNNGCYVVEEIDDDTPIAASNGQHKPSAASASVVDQAAAVTDVKPAAAAGEVIDASFEVVDDKPTPTQAQPEFATAEQRQQIEQLFAALSLTAEQQEKALAKRHANSLRNLTAEAATELIDALGKKIIEIKAAHEASLPDLKVTGDPAAATCGPCTPEQERRIKTAFTEWKQIDSIAADAALAGFKQKLHESGRQRILDLSANDAARLYDAIQVRKLDGFFQRSLETWRPTATASTQPTVAEGQPADQKTAA